MGSNVYLADPRFSNEMIAASASVEQMHPVEKTMTVEQLNKKNAKIFGKGTTPQGGRSPLLVSRSDPWVAGGSPPFIGFRP